MTKYQETVEEGLQLKEPTKNHQRWARLTSHTERDNQCLQNLPEGMKTTETITHTTNTDKGPSPSQRVEKGREMIEAGVEEAGAGKKGSSMSCLHLETPNVTKVRDSLVRGGEFKGRGVDCKMIMSRGWLRSREEHGSLKIGKKRIEKRCERRRKDWRGRGWCKKGWPGRSQRE